MAQPIPPVDPAHLADLSAAATALFSLDDNAAVAGRHYQLDLQAAVRGFDGAGDDAAGRPLFARVDGAIFARPTYKSFAALLDNYTAQTGVSEASTPAQAAEESAFLDACLATRPLRYAHALLVAKGAAPPSLPDFKAVLHQTWFRRYTRAARDDTSGFEHTFVGEVGSGDAAGKVVGGHNWLNFALLERKGQANYFGHIPPKRARADPGDKLVSIQFTAFGASAKDISSMFVGTSPELELALYTLVFLGGSEETRFAVDGMGVCVKAFRIRSKYGDKVGSAFPMLLGKGAGVGAYSTPFGGVGGVGGRPQGGRPPRPQNGGAAGGGGSQPSCGDVVVYLIKLLLKALK